MSSTVALAGYFIVVLAAVTAVVLLWVDVSVKRKSMLKSTHGSKLKVFAKGQMLVTGTGEATLDESLPNSYALLQDPDKYIVVDFDPSEPVPPPCAGGIDDEVDWELTFRHVHDTHFSHHGNDTLQLKIEWRVSGARTVLWTIYRT